MFYCSNILDICFFYLHFNVFKYYICYAYNCLILTSSGHSLYANFTSYNAYYTFPIVNNEELLRYNAFGV